MPQIDLKEISRIAHRWKSHDPHLYEQFLRLLDQWAQEVTVAVTEASNEDILKYQGRAQQAIKTFQVFVQTIKP